MDLRRWLAFVAAALLSTACGGGSAPSTESFAGTWSASKYELVNRASPSTSVELIGQGVSAALVLRADKTYQLTTTLPASMTPPGQSGVQVATGTWSASTDVLTLRELAPLSHTYQFNFVMSGSTLTLTGGGSEWDFNDDGVQEDATLNVTAVKS
jgi:hypothetical protein